MPKTGSETSIITDHGLNSSSGFLDCSKLQHSISLPSPDSARAVLAFASDKSLLTAQMLLFVRGKCRQQACVALLKSCCYFYATALLITIALLIVLICTLLF